MGENSSLRASSLYFSYILHSLVNKTCNNTPSLLSQSARARCISLCRERSQPLFFWETNLGYTYISEIITGRPDGRNKNGSESLTGPSRKVESHQLLLAKSWMFANFLMKILFTRYSLLRYEQEKNTLFAAWIQHQRFSKTC
jgi:hypothetical protein